MPAIHEGNDLHALRSAEVDQRVHGGADGPTRGGNVVDQDHRAFVHRRRHLGPAQARPGAAAHQIVAIERRVENAQRNLEVCDLAQVRGEPARQRDTTVRDRNEIERLRVGVALDQFVGDAHEGPADGNVIEDEAVVARFARRRGMGRPGRRVGRVVAQGGHLSPPRGTELKGPARKSAGRVTQAGRPSISVCEERGR